MADSKSPRLKSNIASSIGAEGPLPQMHERNHAQAQAACKPHVLRLRVLRQGVRGASGGTDAIRTAKRVAPSRLPQVCWRTYLFDGTRNMKT
jgi:hypothetical protein